MDKVYELLSSFININWWIVSLVAVLCYIAANVKIISEKEKGLRIRLGYIIPEELESGPYLTLWPFIKLSKAPKTRIKVDFGTLDEQDVERADKANASETWFVMREPIRINWGDIASSGLNEDEQKQYENDPLAKRLTSDPHLYFIFKIFNLQTLIEVAGGLEEAMDRIKDTCITALQEAAGKTFVAKAIKEIDRLSVEIFEEVQWLVGDPTAKPKNGTKPNESWGVDVLEVRIKDIGTPHRANVAVAERSATVAKAAGESTATILKAKAKRIELTEEGTGRAAAKTVEAEAEKIERTKKGEGEAAAIKAIGDAKAGAISANAKAVSEEGGDLVAKLDALKAGLEHGKTVILPTDMSILTSVLSVKAALDAVAPIAEKKTEVQKEE